MSLTRILKSTQFQELKSKLKECFPNPGLGEKWPILVEPQTTNYSLVGTAFDYLFRFELERMYPNVDDGVWVAESMMESLQTYSGDNPQKRRFAGKSVSHRDFCKIVLEEMDLAKSNYRKFLAGDTLSDELIKGSILLAQIDVIFRAGIYDENFGIYNQRDISDLKALFELFDASKFSFQDRLILNPTFGYGSVMVGGADADIILDDTLIELKVVKGYTLQRSYLNQMIGYCLLSRIGGINGDFDLAPIKRIGIYYARHGKFWSMDLSEFATDLELKDAENWFQRIVANTYGTTVEKMWKSIRGE
jgi:hypothetical protein